MRCVFYSKNCPKDLIIFIYLSFSGRLVPLPYTYYNSNRSFISELSHSQKTIKYLEKYLLIRLHLSIQIKLRRCFILLFALLCSNSLNSYFSLINLRLDGLFISFLDSILEFLLEDHMAL